MSDKTERAATTIERLDHLEANPTHINALYELPAIVRLAQSALRTQTAGEAVAWEGYWPGAGSISSTTKLTKFAGTAEEWEADGADVTPLYAHNIPHPKPVEVGVTDAMMDRVKAALSDTGRGTHHSERIIRTILTAALTDAAKGVEVTARPLSEWHEDFGYGVWFTWRGNDWLGEPSYIGSPNCSDWPGYHTHWLPHPAFPAALTASLSEVG